MLALRSSLRAGTVCSPMTGRYSLPHNFARTRGSPWVTRSNGFHSIISASNPIPNKSIQDLLVLSKTLQGNTGIINSTAPRKQTTAADFLTLMSQMILVGSTAFLLFCAASPHTVSDKLEEYKEQTKIRRHARMLEFMTSDRTYVNGDLGVSEESSDGSSLMFQGQIYHPEIAKDIQGVLFKGPILRYGILTGPAGSGKSKLIRTLVKDEPHYAVLSMGLISGVKSLVDALSEEVGYDFDDWTERMLQGYLFNGNTVTFPTQLDKLAFLLDEIEEASWKLKFDSKSNNSMKRPIIVLDDIDRLDLTQHDMQLAVRMLFNSASKWAREDTALVVFAMGSSALLSETGEIAKLIRPEVLDIAKVYNVSYLQQSEADRFLRDRMGEQLAADRMIVQNVVGTRVFDLMAVCEEVVKTGDSTDAVLTRQLDQAAEHVYKGFSEMEYKFGEAKTRAVVRWLDSMAKSAVSGAPMSLHCFEDARRRGYGDAMKLLLQHDIIGAEGMFSSDLYRNAYRRYRNMALA
ncbi:hypothetical protein BJ741DRAFT_619685 [Chytriomyces cf. hyalinus JEL632]|nr:hypothetical protein BJ741DRAFT_619685 [Chytriomyces cf. hyalinus JEL632]